jgi:hypothetical protein
MATSVTRVMPADLVFEEVPAELNRIAKRRSSRLVLVETDDHSCFRHGVNCDVRVFVMAGPANLHDVFRTAREAEAAARRAMNDTGQFAWEILGLEPENPTARVRPDPRSAAVGTVEPEPLPARIGSSIAARLLLQPAYHALVESDVVILNLGVGGDGEIAERCAGRIEQMLSRMRQDDGRRIWFAACDPLDGNDPLAQRAIERIEQLIAAPASGA